MDDLDGAVVFLYDAFRDPSREAVIDNPQSSSRLFDGFVRRVGGIR